MTEAKCSGTDTNIFFTPSLEAEAKAICQHCLIRVPCGEYAVRVEMFGVWGGLSAEERVRLRVENDIRRVKIERIAEEIHDHDSSAFPHGTRNRYVMFGCRCEECRESEKQYARDLRRRKRMMDNSEIDG